MKTFDQFIPPVNKLIVLLICSLLLFSIMKQKGNNNEPGNIEKLFIVKK